jgi:hypothetical protein
MAPPPGTTPSPWIPLIGIAAVLAASLLYRKMHGKPLVYRRLEGTRFRQTNASGRSHRSWWTRLASAKSCLVVQVTDRELDIHPFPPFNWFFMPEIYGLEHRVALTDVRSAEVRKRIVRHSVDITIRTDRGDEKLTLFLSDPEGFVRALGVEPLVTTAR